MASGQSLFSASAADLTPTGTLAAARGVIVGGSTPAENLPVAWFDSATDEYMDFVGVMPTNYAGGGVTLIIQWTSTATTGNTVWRAAFRRVADDAEDVDTSHTYDYNSVTATTASVAGEWDYATITFTDGADMDSVAAGEGFVLRLTRNASDGTNDTMTGDAGIVLAHAKET